MPPEETTDPRQARNSLMEFVYMFPAWAAAIAAVISMASKEPLHRWSERIAYGLVMVAPLARIGWLLRRWVWRRDWRFVLAIGALAATISLAWLIARGWR